MKYLVTGATGFIGEALCCKICDQGHELVATSLRGGKISAGVSVTACNLTMGGYEALLSGIDTIFHTAGIAHQQARPQDYEQVNHLATVELARAAAQAGVKSFVYLSSVKAMGPGDDIPKRREGDCRLPEDAYGLSKWRAEEALRAEFANSAMRVVILRPALVYGGSPKGNLATLVSAVKRGIPTLPEVGGRSMIAREDLLQLLMVAAKEAPAGVSTWIACDGQSYSTARLSAALRRALAQQGSWITLPHWLWRGAAGVIDLGRGRRWGETAERLFGTELYDASAVLAATSWRPLLQFEDCAARMLSADSPEP